MGSGLYFPLPEFFLPKAEEMGLVEVRGMQPIRNIKHALFYNKKLISFHDALGIHEVLTATLRQKTSQAN
jgi:hypothetical protein